MNILIVGGSDAGISAALRARELNQAAEIKVLLADDFPNFSICGLLFFLSGETPDRRQLAHRTEFEGIEVLRKHRATQIDAENGFVFAKCEGTSKGFSYDRLIIGTGAVPVRPPIEGLNSHGVFLSHTNHVTNVFTYRPLGSTSHKQGRVAGENAAGADGAFSGIVGTQVVKIFELAIVRTGLLDRQVRDAAFDAFTVQTEAWDHETYYPGAKKLWLHITGDRSLFK